MFVCINLFFFEIITPCGSEKCKKSASTRSVYLAWHEYNAWRLYVCPSVCNVRWCLAITRCNRKWKWAHDEACRSRPTSQYSVIMNMQEQSRPVGYGKMKFCPLAVTISETVQAGTIIKKLHSANLMVHLQACHLRPLEALKIAFRTHRIRLSVSRPSARMSRYLSICRALYFLQSRCPTMRSNVPLVRLFTCFCVLSYL